jgi:hypothetical protein
VATNLTNLGFTADGPNMEVLARKTFQNGKATRCKHGTYIVWAHGNGIELWAQLSSNEELIGLNPHFAGKTRTSAGLVQRVSRAGFPMDGGFTALAQPYGSDPIRGAFTFVFDTPNFLLQEALTLPLICSVQLAAFAQQCALFQNEKEFQTQTSKFGLSLATDAFIPLGLVGKNREPLADPIASAMVCGAVLDAQQITNAVSKGQFWWMKIRTTGGEIDVVADPELLPRGVKVGQILQCSAWISGRIHD